MRHVLRSVMVAALVALLVPLAGCPSFGADNSVQAQMDKMMSRLEPIVLKAVEQTNTSNLSAAGGVHAISPGYRGRISGVFGPAFIGEFDIELKNVAGQLQWSVAGQGGEDEPPPVAVESAPKPESDPFASVAKTVRLIKLIRSLDEPVPVSSVKHGTESQPAATQPAEGK